MKSIILFSFILFISCISCKSNKETASTPGRPGKEDMEELNRYLVQKDREIIQNYIERKKLNMIETPTGLWYTVEVEGSGNLLRENDRIILTYECYLLDGTLCYSSKTLGPKEIILGKSDLEPGLNEGLRLLKPGAKALFILPPFMAYGFVGDGKKIPPRSILVYEIEIIPGR